MENETHQVKPIAFPLLVALGIFAIDLALPLGVASAVPYAAVVLLTFSATGIRPTLLAAAVASLLTVLGLLLSPPGGEWWKVLINRGLAIFIIWASAALIIQRQRAVTARETALAERELALAQLKVLRGLLPICASCKKIRRESGAWQMLENYISEHSEAEFTHGVCPECIARLYPEFSGDSPEAAGPAAPGPADE